MSQKEIQIQKGQWKDVAILQMAMTEYAVALRKMKESKEKFGIPLASPVSVDMETEKIIYFDNGE